MAKRVTIDTSNIAVTQNANSIERTFIPRILDPVEQQTQAKYRSQGITYISNNTDIVPRDTAGNISLTENSETNPLLIIDPVAEKINTKSMLRVLNTRFQYYKFPVQVLTSGSLDLDITLDQQDPVYARYKPSENRKIPSGGEFSGILIDEIEDGQPQKNTNAYYITKDIKNSGVDLRFRININHRYDTPNWNSQSSTVAFTIIKNGPNYRINRSFKGQFSRSGLDGRWSVITPYEIWDTYIDITILNSEFDIGDNFSIGANSSVQNDTYYHTINSEQTYWVITDASKNVDEWNQPIE